MTTMRRRSAQAAEPSPEVAEASERLRAALEESEDVDDPTTFASANAARQEAYPGYFDRVVERVVVEDPEEAYRRIVEWLGGVSERRSDLPFLRDLLSRAPGMHNLAHRLLVTAKLAKERVEVSNAGAHSAMRETARRILQKQKDDGKRSKVISEQDIENYCATEYHDKWSAIENARYRASKLVDQLESMVKSVTIATSVLEVLIKA